MAAPSHCLCYACLHWFGRSVIWHCMYCKAVLGHAGLRQILAVDVLTGKCKEMLADSSMRNAPKIEDKSIGRLGGCCTQLPLYTKIAGSQKWCQHNQHRFAPEAMKCEKFAGHDHLGSCLSWCAQCNAACVLCSGVQQFRIAAECFHILLCSACRRLGISELRYDSIKATHPQSGTPIYVTYNSGHGYPKYLITYR